VLKSGVVEGESVAEGMVRLWTGGRAVIESVG
jgi:hypothetical protein